MEDIFQQCFALSLKEIKYDKTLPKNPNSDTLMVNGSPDVYPISYQQNKFSSIDIFQQIAVAYFHFSPVTMDKYKDKDCTFIYDLRMGRLFNQSMILNLIMKCKCSQKDAASSFNFIAITALPSRLRLTHLS